MIVIQFATYGVLGLTYLGLALGYIPGLRMIRATIALVGSAFLIGLGVLNLQEAWEAIDVNTIVFLLSMMIVNANLSYGGFFRRSLSLLLSLTRSPLGLIIALTFGSGILSALFLNDTIALIFTPLTLSLTQSLGLNPIPYLLAIAGASNIGSVATNYLNMTQGVNNTNAQNQMQIGMNDQQNKISMLSQVPGMQLGAANFGLQKTNTQLGANSADVANAMQGAAASNTFNLGQYQTQMAGYGAGQTAQATANQKK